MTTAIHTNSTSIAYSVEALRHRILAAEADLNALIAVRTDADAIQRTEATYRGLIVKQDRYRRLVDDFDDQVAWMRIGSDRGDSAIRHDRPCWTYLPFLNQRRRAAVQRRNSDAYAGQRHDCRRARGLGRYDLAVTEIRLHQLGRPTYAIRFHHQWYGSRYQRQLPQAIKRFIWFRCV
jgi:hypothetical protein